VNKSDEIFMDANGIIAAFAVKAWKPLAAFFRLNTTDSCVIEAATGDRSRKTYIPVDDALVRMTATILKPTTKQLAQLDLSLRGVILDAGERDLLACAMTHPGAWLLCSSDKAAVCAMHVLGNLDRVVSLEALTRTAKIGVSLGEPFTEKWMGGVRTQLLLESL
jgi:hypothetical protein